MAALPALLKEINNAGVARLTVIDAIANLVGVPIPFPAEDCTLEDARAHVQLRGIQLGFIKDKQPTT